MRRADRVERLEKYLEIDPNNEALLHDLANAYQEVGQSNKALELYQRLLKESGESSVLLNTIGNVYLSIGEWTQAEKIFEQALRIDPEVPELLFNLAYAKFSGGDAASARKHFARLVEISPNESRFQYYLGLACEDLNDAAGAKKAFDATLKIDPDHPGALLFLAMQELENGRLKEARERAEQILRKNPRSIDALVLKAQVAMLDFEADKALSILRQAQSNAQNNAYISTLLGQTLLMLQRITQARRELESSVLLDPESTQAYISLGWATALQDDVTASESAFQNALKLDPQDPDAHSGLALIRLAQGNNAEAQRELDQALKLDENNLPGLLLKVTIKEQEAHDSSQKMLRELFDTYTFGPFGWSYRTTMEKFGQSVTGKKVLGKIIRRARMKGRYPTVH